jgi:starch synthase
MVASELAPLAATGGLGDTLRDLPDALRARDHQVSAVLPFYRAIRENRAIVTQPTGVRFTLPVGAKKVEAAIHETRLANGTQVFLVARDEYFDRTSLYGTEGRSYDDNAERFVFFQKAAVELARRIDPAPDLLHAHDWQAALVPVFAREWGLPFKTVLTLHNLAFQGAFLGVDFGLTNLPGHLFASGPLEFYGSFNFLKAGILFADAISTLSERYARDIQSPEFGCGLDGVLRENARKLHGILSGTDYSTWNPATDPALPAKFSPRDPSGKTTCRNALLEHLNLDPNPAGPLFLLPSHVARHRGLELLLPLLDRLLADDVRLAVFGEAEKAHERDLLLATRKHARRFAFHREADPALLHLAFAGADATLFPELIDPSGSMAMRALKYGAPPVARACGGLHQIVRDYDPASGQGNGFLFFDYRPDALWDAIKRARATFAQPATWQAIADNAMASDFSWAAAAAAYEKLYRWVLGR